MDYVVNTVAAGGVSAHAVLGVFDIGSCFDAVQKANRGRGSRSVWI